MSQKGFASVWIILLLIAIVAVGVVFFLTPSEKSLQPVGKDSTQDLPDESDEADKFIVANPVDLSQIQRISKFRSCAGHDFSGKNVDGVREENRSMKHYFKPADSLASSIGEVKVFAPFNGRIKSVRDEREPRGKETILSSETTSWDVTIFHLDLLPTLEQGSSISAGQLIGHAHIASRGNDFDIAVTKFVGGMPRIPPEIPDKMEKMQSVFFSMIMMDSMFNYMTADVLSDFEKFGITSKNIIISKEERDLAPCTFTEKTEKAADWIELQS